MVQQDGSPHADFVPAAAGASLKEDPSSPALLLLNEGEKGERQQTANGRQDACGTGDGRQDACGTGDGRQPHSVWQTVSGLFPDVEATMSASERRYALRKLYKEYVARVRAELANVASDVEKDERSFMWDPIAAVCFDLGIARRKLSALTKELTGMAAHDVVDKIRAERIHEKLRTGIDALCRRRLEVGQAHEEPGGPLNFILDALKDERRGAHFERNHYAITLGFANHARMRRGCMLAHNGLTPQQVEVSLAGELAEFYDAASSIGERDNNFGDAGWLEERIGEPVDDAWAQVQAERPAWVAAMLGRLGGVSKKYEQLAAIKIYARPSDPNELKSYEQERGETNHFLSARAARLAHEQKLMDEEERMEAAALADDDEPPVSTE